MANAGRVAGDEAAFAANYDPLIAVAVRVK